MTDTHPALDPELVARIATTGARLRDAVSALEEPLAEARATVIEVDQIVPDEADLVAGYMAAHRSGNTLARLQEAFIDREGAYTAS
jgi:hypothetical protein